MVLACAETASARVQLMQVLEFSELFLVTTVTWLIRLFWVDLSKNTSVKIKYEIVIKIIKSFK